MDLYSCSAPQNSGISDALRAVTMSKPPRKMHMSQDSGIGDALGAVAFSSGYLATSKRHRTEASVMLRGPWNLNLSPHIDALGQ